MLAKYGQRQEAVEVDCATEGLAPGSRQAYWMLGRFLCWGVGDRARAAEYLRDAVRVEPRAVDAHLDLARCLRQMGRIDEADEHLEEARRLDPTVTL